MKKTSIVLAFIFLVWHQAALLGDPATPAGTAAQDNVIHFTQPTEGQHFPIGTKVIIAWDKNSISETKLLLYMHNAYTNEQISGALQVDNTGIYDKKVVDVEDDFGTYYVRLSNYSHTKSGRSANFEFVPGVILVTKPAAGQSLTINMPGNIEWDKNALNAIKYYATVLLQVYSVKLQAAGGAYPVANTGVYSWTPKSNDFGQNKILVSTSDGKFKGESGVFAVAMPKILQKTFKKGE